MKDKKQFTLNIGEHEFVSDTDGYLNLNDIHRALGLPDKKAPRQWRNAIQKDLVSGEDLVKKIKTSTKSITYPGAQNCTPREVNYNVPIEAWYGNETSAIAYAMWVDVDFYRLVVDAFVDLRNGRIEDAIEKAKQSGAVEDKAFKKWMSYADTPPRDACGMLGLIIL